MKKDGIQVERFQAWDFEQDRWTTTTTTAGNLSGSGDAAELNSCSWYSYSGRRRRRSKSHVTTTVDARKKHETNRDGVGGQPRGGGRWGVGGYCRWVGGEGRMLWAVPWHGESGSSGQLVNSIRRRKITLRFGVEENKLTASSSCKTPCPETLVPQPTNGPTAILALVNSEVIDVIAIETATPRIIITSRVTSQITSWITSRVTSLVGLRISFPSLNYNESNETLR